MFERFTQAARSVVVEAHEEARRLGHGWIGTEHVVIALADDTGIAGEVLGASGVTPDALRTRLRTAAGSDEGDLDATALRSLGIDLDDVRRSVEETFGQGALDDQPRPSSGTPRRRRWSGGHVPFTQRAKKSLELALREAAHLGHHHLGSEHLLIGVLDEGGGTGVRLLRDLGVDVNALRAATVERARRSA